LNDTNGIGGGGGIRSLGGGGSIRIGRAAGSQRKHHSSSADQRQQFLFHVDLSSLVICPFKAKVFYGMNYTTLNEQSQYLFKKRFPE
jgi:hypothetical protein